MPHITLAHVHIPIVLEMSPTSEGTSWYLPPPCPRYLPCPDCGQDVRLGCYPQLAQDDSALECQCGRLFEVIR